MFVCPAMPKASVIPASCRHSTSSCAPFFSGIVDPLRVGPRSRRSHAAAPSSSLTYPFGAMSTLTCFSGSLPAQRIEGSGKVPECVGGADHVTRGNRSGPQQANGFFKIFTRAIPRQDERELFPVDLEIGQADHLLSVRECQQNNQAPDHRGLDGGRDSLGNADIIEHDIEWPARCFQSRTEIAFVRQDKISESDSGGEFPASGYPVDQGDLRSAAGARCVSTQYPDHARADHCHPLARLQLRTPHRVRRECGELDQSPGFIAQLGRDGNEMRNRDFHEFGKAAAVFMHAPNPEFRAMVRNIGTARAAVAAAPRRIDRDPGPDREGRARADRGDRADELMAWSHRKYRGAVLTTNGRYVRGADSGPMNLDARL